MPAFSDSLISGLEKNGPKHQKRFGPLPFAEAGKVLNWLVLANLGGKESRVKSISSVFNKESTHAHGIALDQIPCTRDAVQIRNAHCSLCAAESLYLESAGLGESKITRKSGHSECRR